MWARVVPRICFAKDEDKLYRLFMKSNIRSTILPHLTNRLYFLMTKSIYVLQVFVPTVVSQQVFLASFVACTYCLSVRVLVLSAVLSFSPNAKRNIFLPWLEFLL